jgi:hypothetical protein
MEDEMGRARSMHGEKRTAYRVWRESQQRQLGRHRHTHSWEDKIKMDLSEMGLSDMGWINMAQDMGEWKALVNMVMNLGFHEMLGNS